MQPVLEDFRIVKVMEKVCFLVLVFLTFFGTAQSTFQTIIQKENVSSPNWIAQSITETSNGNIYAVGLISPGGSFTKCRLIKLDPSGVVQWDTIYSYTSAHEFEPEIIPTIDNGILLASESYSNVLNDIDSTKDILLWKINSSGNIEWAKVLSSREFVDMTTTTDGGFLIMGDVSEKKYGGGSDIILYKINQNGDVLWTTQLGIWTGESPFHYETSISVRQIDDQIYVCGYHRFNSLDLDGIIYSIDTLGNELWNILIANTPTEDKARIHSVFKFDHRFYFNSTYGMYEFNVADGDYWEVPDSLAIGFYDTGYNFSVSCGINRITALDISTSVYSLNYFENILEPYYQVSIPAISGTFYEMITTNDGGYLVLTGSGQQMQITKTDCLGNVAFWSEDCNSKIPVDNDILIYPNPSQNEVLIEATFDFDEVVIYTINGDLYKYLNPCSCPRMTLDVSDFSSGVYVVRISNSEQNSITRFIKI